MKFYFTLFLSCLTLTGCQVINLVSVKQVDLNKTLNNDRSSILTDNELSNASKNILMMVQPKIKTCVNSPDECMQLLQQAPEIDEEQYLSTGSELYLSHALQLKNKPECQSSFFQSETNKQIKQQKQQQFLHCSTQYAETLNQSIRYSYAYLFATQRQPEKRLFNNRQIQVKDFYNQAVTQLLIKFNQDSSKNIDYNQLVDIGLSQYKINTEQYPQLDIKQIKQISSTYNLKFTGLNTLSRRDGFGTEFVIQLKQPEYPDVSTTVNYAQQKIDVFHHPNIHLGEYLPATVVIEPTQQNSIQDILNSRQFKLNLINPNQYQYVTIRQQQFQLAANFSAPYGLWLANSKMGTIGLNTLLYRDKSFISPQLFMLEPYQPNKKIIIMIHGLASSPEAWIATSNDIMNDPTLRNNYQIWQIFYSTNMPILENHYQIYHLLDQTLNTIDQKYPQYPVQDIVLIGHSMGGVISRLLVSHDDLSANALDYIKKKCKNCRKKNHAIQQLVTIYQPYLQLTSLTPRVKRAIFIASPFRGTSFADKWFTQAARKIIKLPITFVTGSIDRLNYQFNDDDIHFLDKELKQELLQNGAGDLSPESLFMHMTANIQIDTNLPYHVIVGNNTSFNDPKLMTDGIVPYPSSHLDGAVSEKIIPSGHSVQYTPEAVLELRRILHLHLKK